MSINLEQLGVAAVTVTILISYNWQNRRDLLSEREYSRRLNELFQESSEKTLQTLLKLEQAFQMLQEKIK